MNELIEALREAKELCEHVDCSECPLSVGIYQEGLNYTYYSCDIRKKPKDWDLDKKRMKQTKNSKKGKPEKEEKPKKKRGRKKKEAKDDEG